MTELAITQGIIEWSMQPFSAVGQNIQNWFAGKLNIVGAVLMDAAADLPIIKDILKRQEELGKLQDNKLGVIEFLQDIANRDFGGPQIQGGGDVGDGGDGAQILAHRRQIVGGLNQIAPLIPWYTAWD